MVASKVHLPSGTQPCTPSRALQVPPSQSPPALWLPGPSPWVSRVWAGPVIWVSGSHVGQEPHPGTGTHTLVQALGRLRELGHQQDYGGVTADLGGPPSRRVARGSISGARSSACLGKGSCLGWRLSAGGEGKGRWDVKPGGWVGRGVDRASSELVPHGLKE